MCGSLFLPAKLREKKEIETKKVLKKGKMSNMAFSLWTVCAISG
jgi:hypothetical protein